jgi:hypothetical protein
MAADAWTVTDGGVLLAAAVLLPFLGMLLGLWSAGAFLAYPPDWAKPMIVAVEVALMPTLVLVLALLLNGAPARGGDR